MQKLLVLFLTIIIAISFCGCNDQDIPSKTTAGGENIMSNAEFDTEYVNLRNGLTNTYNKLKIKKQLTVAYLGGSITAGAGAENPDTDSWRALVTTYLKEKFEDTEIFEINIGIGSTGSLLPSFYVDDYVIPKKPDLVFLEMAVNDYLDGSSESKTSIQYEIIVRKLLTANPLCEIVSLYTINDVLSAIEEYYPQAKAQNDIAVYYGIPSANIGRKLKKEKGLMQPKINGVYSSKWMAYFADEVHPNNEGHKEYANTVIYLLDSAFKLAENGSKVKKIDLPQPKNKNINLNTNFILASDLDLSKSYGWKSITTDTTSGLCINKNICTDNPDNELTFMFEGRNLYFYSSTIPFDEAGKLFKVSIDGGEWQQVGPSGAHPITIAENLKEGTHTVKFVAGGVGKNSNAVKYQTYNLTAILVK